MLVVGASATGVQIACEVQRSGREVTLAVGEHVRGPRDYRGRDIHWWMEAAGVLDERYDEVDDIVRARRVPSMQLAGSPERATFDLNALTNTGVKLVGRLAGIKGSQRPVLRIVAQQVRARGPQAWPAAATPSMSGPLRTASTTRCRRLTGSHRLLSATHRRSVLISASGEIETVIWATGFRPDYSWLDIPVLDGKGMLRHDGGVVDSPGMFLLGAARFCAAANRASSTVPGRTPKNSWSNSPPILDRRASSSGT